MNFDMTFMSDLALPLVVAACLILGYIMKQWVKDMATELKEKLLEMPTERKG